MWKKFLVSIGIMMLFVSIQGRAINRTNSSNPNIPVISYEEIQGQSYKILEEGDGYMIIEIDGEVYFVVM